MLHAQVALCRMLTLCSQLRVDLAAAHRAAHNMGLNEGIDNHFTVMLPKDEHDDTTKFLVIPFGLMWSEVTADDWLLMDDTGKIISGANDLPDSVTMQGTQGKLMTGVDDCGWPDETAFFIHAALHKGRKDAVCVLHTHMPYATALCCIQQNKEGSIHGAVQMCHQNSIRWADGGIAYDDTFNGLALGSEEGDRLLSVMGSRPEDPQVLMHANHGVVVVGGSIAEAFDTLYFLERACMVQVLAMSTGNPLKIISQDVGTQFVADMKSYGAIQCQQHFEAIKRELKRNGRDGDFCGRRRVVSNWLSGAAVVAALVCALAGASLLRTK